MARTNTTGDEMPADFPTQIYNGFHGQTFDNTFDVAARHPDAWPQYGGAFNAIAYRFIGMSRAHDDFRRAFTPSGASRCDEEIALHAFFVCGLSAVECSAYAAFGILSMIDNSRFPITVDTLKRETSPSAISRACSGDAVLDALGTSFGAIDQSPIYRELKEIRNTLTHRQSPPRKIFLTAHAGASRPPAPERPTELQLGHLRLSRSAPTSIDFQSTMLDPYRAWVVTALTSAIQGMQSVAPAIPH